MTKSITSECSDNEGFVDYLISVSRGRHGVVPALLRFVCAALAQVYCAGLEVYLLPYRIGLRRRVKLSCRVISVGNLTTGGTGKTPMTQSLCRQLTDNGLTVAILSRGYGGRFEHGCAVVSDGSNLLLGPQEAGDEAYLLAKTLPGVPVIVGKDRRKSGRMAVERFQPDVTLLDDGMQYWQLHRDVEIVLLNSCDPFDNGWTFPRGLLREPPSHLARANVVVLTNARRAGRATIEDLLARVRRLAPGKPVFTADLMACGLCGPGTGQVVATDWIVGRRIGALSAVGNPSAFEAMIGDLGGVLAARSRFRDHHRLSGAELDKAIVDALAAGAEAVITTEKDAVKMTLDGSKLPVLALQVRMQVDDEQAFLAAIAPTVQAVRT